MQYANKRKNICAKLLISENKVKGKTMAYILVTVCEREIVTEQFATFEKARSQMMDEVAEEFFKADVYTNYLAEEELNNERDEFYAWDKISSREYYTMALEDYVGDGNGFEFGRDWAWSNLNEDYRYDWKIVEVK